ncbi:MAG: hypothetical protein ACP5OG_02920 [Candidatus Nanoarchaeia archaeon]
MKTRTNRIINLLNKIEEEYWNLEAKSWIDYLDSQDSKNFTNEDSQRQKILYIRGLRLRDLLNSGPKLPIENETKEYEPSNNEIDSTNKPIFGGFNEDYEEHLYNLLNYKPEEN